MDFEELRRFNSISDDSINYMLDIIKKNELKKVLEIGCLLGYSALMFSTAAESVKTIEISKDNIKQAKKNFEKFNVKNIELVEGDARNVLNKLNEKFDFIFIDAVKEQYKEYLILALKLIDKGFIYADNTISHKEYMEDFFEYLKNSKLKWKELGLGRGLVEVKI